MYLSQNQTFSTSTMMFPSLYHLIIAVSGIAFGFFGNDAYYTYFLSMPSMTTQILIPWLQQFAINFFQTVDHYFGSILWLAIFILRTISYIMFFLSLNYICKSIYNFMENDIMRTPFVKDMLNAFAKRHFKDDQISSDDNSEDSSDYDSDNVFDNSSDDLFLSERETQIQTYRQSDKQSERQPEGDITQSQCENGDKTHNEFGIALNGSNTVYV
jgi:hypothetical protein